MAVLAVEPEDTGMDLRLGMALAALGRRASENLVRVAGLALDHSVPAVQWKYPLVVEAPHTIYTIMAV
jgi:hypothetical protein